MLQHETSNIFSNWCVLGSNFLYLFLQHFLCEGWKSQKVHVVITLMNNRSSCENGSEKNELFIYFDFFSSGKTDNL